jgi:hypothetical protein
MSSEKEKLGEVLLDARADEIDRARGDTPAAFFNQTVDRLADGDARNRQIGGEFALRGQRVFGPRMRFSIASRSTRCTCWYSGWCLSDQRAKHFARALMRYSDPGDTKPVRRLVPRQYHIDTESRSRRRYQLTGSQKSPREYRIIGKTRAYGIANGRLELFFKLGFHLSKIGSMLALLW